MRQISTFFVLFLISLPLCLAQEEEGPTPLGPGRGSAAIYLGPVAGYNRAIHSADLASFADTLNLCPNFKNGTANGFFIGGFYEQILGGITSKHSVVVRILYSSMPASFTQGGDTYPSLVDDGKGGVTTVLSTTLHTLDVTYALFTFEAMYKFNVASGIVLTAGPSFDIPIQKRLLQKYKIIEPNNIRFKAVPQDKWKEFGIVRYEDNFRTLVARDGDLIRPENPSAKSNVFRFALKFGVQYEIITGSKIDVIPGIFYNLGLTGVNNVETWKVSAVQAGVDVRFTL